MIRFACPHCQKGFQVDDKAAGKTTKCPECKGAFMVPAAQQSPAPIPVAPSPTAKRVAAVVDKDDIYGIAVELTTQSENGRYGTSPEPSTDGPFPVLGRRDYRPTPASRSGHSARRKRPSMALLAIGGILLIGVTVGVTLWATGALSKSQVDPEKQAGTRQIASSSVDASHSPVKETQSVPPQPPQPSAKSTPMERFKQFVATVEKEVKQRGAVPSLFAKSQGNKPEYKPRLFRVSYDLRKTDSLVSPIVGILDLQWEEGSGHVFGDDDKSDVVEYAAQCKYAYSEERWVLQDATVRITNREKVNHAILDILKSGLEEYTTM